MIHIYRYDISRHVFFNYLIKIAHYFYQFPLINFILCNHESIFKHRDEIKKYIYTNTSNNHMFSLLSTKSIS